MRISGRAWKGLVASLALLGACSPKTVEEEDVRPVRAVVVKPSKDGEKASLTGEIKARYESDLAFRIGGKIIARPVDIGSEVKSGDILARLDPEPSQKTLQSAKADAGAAQASLTKFKAAEERQAQLVKDGYTTRANYDDAVAALKTAQSQYDAAMARLSQAEDNLNYTDLRADVDGVITSVSANIGQVVAAGQAVVRLAQPGEIEAVFNVSEALLSKKPEKVPVTISLVADPTISTTGTIRYVSPQADPVTRTFEVRVSLENAPAEMRLGASVTGSAELDKGAIVSLPGGALFESDDKPAVWIVDPQTMTVSLKPIAVSRYTSDEIVVSSGLAEGDIVVTAGVQKLIPGQKVRLLQAQTK